MRIHIPDMAIGLQIALLWVIMVALLVLAYGLARWWRRHHPLPPAKPPEPSYARSLTRRFAARSAKSNEHSGGKESPS